MKTAQIIINIGAPSQLTENDAKDFLYEFLSDKHMLTIPAPFRQLLAKFIASKHSVSYLKNLKSICGNEAIHPLAKYTNSLATKIEKLTNKRTFAAFRYGQNSISKVLQNARNEGYDSFVAIPMFPQNAYSTTQSAKEEFLKNLKKNESYRFVENYYSNSLYLDAIAEVLNSKISHKTDAVLVSFHSVPISHTFKTPYKNECEFTFEALKKRSNCDNFILCWQSKMGKGKWIEPSAVDTVKALVKSGAKNIVSVCPGFACDCTETLIEIGDDLKKDFLENSGESFEVVECLNDSDIHAKLFASIFERHTIC